MVETKHTTTQLTSSTLPYTTGVQKTTEMHSTTFQHPVQETRRETVQAPILEKVIEQKEYEGISKQYVEQTKRQEVVEVHEQPIIKNIQHAPIELKHATEMKYEEHGKEQAFLEKERMLHGLKEQGMHHKVLHETEVRHSGVVQQAPVYAGEQRIVEKEIHNVPIVTEIHRQPVIEIHEQNIQRVVYEKPLITKIVHQPIVEQSTMAEPLRDVHFSHQQQHQQPIVHQQQHVVHQQQHVVHQPQQHVVHQQQHIVQQPVFRETVQVHQAPVYAPPQQVHVHEQHVHHHDQHRPVVVETVGYTGGELKEKKVHHDDHHKYEEKKLKHFK